MSGLNFDENSINKLKDMMNKGELNDVISKIPPEMIQNFSSMMNSSNSNDKRPNSPNNFNNLNNSNVSNASNMSSQNGSFDLGNIDMNTILKMKSVMDGLNSSNDPSSNLLQSLKPYLREERKEKVDKYANILNVAKIANLLNNNNNRENNNG